MRRIILCATAVMLAGCAPDLAGVEEMDRAAMDLARQLRVTDVVCMTDSLSIAAIEESACMAFNADSTRIAWDNYPLATGGWRSTNPSAVAVSIQGYIYAGTVAGAAWIVAEGTFGTADSVQVWSY